MSHTAKVPYGPADVTDWPTVPALASTGLDYLADRTKTLEAGAGTGGFTFVRKTADESVTSSTTLQNDNDLFFPIAANEIWHVKGVIIASSASATPDLRVRINGPTGSTGSQSFIALDPSNTTANGAVNSSASYNIDGAGAVGFGSAAYSGTDTPAFFDVLIVNGSTAGNVQVVFAQNVSNGTAITVKAGSYIIGTRVSPIQPAGANYGAMQLVSRQVLAAAATSITFTGLDLSADSTYYIRFGLKNATASANVIRLFYNGDTTTTNYNRQSISAANTSVTGTRANVANITGIPASSYNAGELRVYKPAGADTARATAWYSENASASIVYIQIAHAWTNAANVTQMAFTGDQANGLDIGSYIEIYRLAPVPLAIGALKNYAFVRKLAAESVTSSTALQDDDELFFAIGANETWKATFDIILSPGAAAADFVCALSAPTGAVGSHANIMPSTGGTGNTDSNFTAHSGSVFTDSFTHQSALNATASLIAKIEVLVVNSTTAGQVKLRWAQLVSNATATVVAAHSTLEARRVA